jgi:hypothetical protein
MIANEQSLWTRAVRLQKHDIVPALKKIQKGEELLATL